jgi:hypothetical protein
MSEVVVEARVKGGLEGLPVKTRSTPVWLVPEGRSLSVVRGDRVWVRMQNPTSNLQVSSDGSSDS